MSDSTNDNAIPNPLLPVRKLQSQVAPQHTLIIHEEVPEVQRPQRRAGPRRQFPKVPEGTATPDLTPSPPAPGRKLASPQILGGQLRGLAASAFAGVTISTNAELSSAASSSMTSSVSEPSAASNGNQVFYAANWFSAVSNDGGISFKYIDPYHSFPDPPGMTFCCDQVVHYIPSADMFVWLLQYNADTNNQNMERLAFATTAEMQANQWRTYDISPTTLALPLMMLDFPDISFSNNNLYVTCNAFDAAKHWNTCLILRIPLGSLVSGSPSADVWSTNQNFALRAAQHCGTIAYFASHQDTSTLRLFSWDEAAVGPTINDIKVPSWIEAPFVSMTPDGFNWLERADSRILGATYSNGKVWFAWGANAGGANNRPNPYAQVACIDTGTLTLQATLNVWDPTLSIQYAALDCTSIGDVGLSYFCGGATTFPSHAVGFLTGVSDHVTTAAGLFGPVGQAWGDFLTVRRCHPNGTALSATSFVQKTGNADKDIAPRYVVFSR